MSISKAYDFIIESETIRLIPFSWHQCIRRIPLEFSAFNYQLLAIPFLRGYNIGNGIMGQQTENKFDRSLKDQNNSVTLI